MNYFYLIHKLPLRIKNIISNHFTYLLVITVLISYGQMLGMYIWQDDNALFFKLAHIDEPAGYFGKGPIGNSITKWAVTPFIPVYFLFGHNEFFYFAFLLSLFLISALLTYKTFSFILGDTGGKVTGFIYSAGYIISDGFWRMANSATTSISLILLNLFLYSYWKFYKLNNWFWYGMGILFYYLATEFTVVRTHYFFIVIVFLELLVFAFRRFPQSLFLSVLRLLPFFYIFKTYVAGSDARVGTSVQFALAIFEGRFDQYFGLLSTLANLTFPDWFQNYFFEIQKWLDRVLMTHIPILQLFLLTTSFIFIIILRKNRFKFLLIPLFIIILFSWVIIAIDLFKTPLLQPSNEQIFTVTLGGNIILLGLLIFLTIGKYRWLFLFLVSWMMVNMSAYSTYYPMIPYESVHRYMAHSFLPLVGIWGVIFISLSSKMFWGRIGRMAIILLGIGNIITAVIYQNTILFQRSFPAREFYSQLKSLMPTLEKGDVLYFDIADNVRRYYGDAIATAMMPETTAFAWRYGVDRYDIKLVTDFSELNKAVTEDKIDPDQINAFWYSDEGLKDVSQQIRNYFRGMYILKQPKVNLTQPSIFTTKLLGNTTYWEQPEIKLSFDQPLINITPIELSFKIMALPLSYQDNLFPLAAETKGKELFKFNSSLQSLAFEYKRWLQKFRKDSKVSISTTWQDKVAKNLIDGDVTSLWQSDRTQWGIKNTFLMIQLPQREIINRLVWVNGSPQNAPTGYTIEVSDDGEKWHHVKTVNEPIRLAVGEYKIITFEPIKTTFLRITFNGTLNNDSPIVAEVWAVPVKFGILDLKEVETFLSNPFAWVDSYEAFLQIFKGLDAKGKIEVWWLGNKSNSWQTEKEAEIEITYDGLLREYKMMIPAGGTEITALKIDHINVPGFLTLKDLNIEVLSSNMLP